MNQQSLQRIAWLSLSVIVLSIVALANNHFNYQYQGNNYFPDHTPAFYCILILIAAGAHLYYQPNHPMRQKARELILFLALMSLVALATNAVQLTPYPPIDAHIIKWEASLHIHLQDWMIWLNQYSELKQLLIVIYDSLPYQMTLIPLACIAAGNYKRLHEYYLLTLKTLLIGFVFYYFYPTVAPATAFASDLFAPAQQATGIKFMQIHEHLRPETLEGGLIAMPSFHVIWAALCVYLTADWRFLFYLLGLINLLLTCSCVLLGWHYFSDVIASFVVLAIAYKVRSLLINPYLSAVHNP